ncbi:hypothetical protein [Massilia varians]|uniref:hypothetical protein n=1 Tax=Massilia varians TaxID=457921 RepID=UPI0025574C84|nr:hypothetical protein [Massilia varians]MDK6078960.1 hypothetical protein [Massilia varians]
MIKTETMSDVMLRALRKLIANDGYAMTFQSMGQYRAALLSHFDNLVDMPDHSPALQPQAAVVSLDAHQQDAAQVSSLAKPRLPAVCVSCRQPQGAEHLATCPFKRFTVSTGEKGTAS